MQQLNRSMMERYEIPDRRPEKLRALMFLSDPSTMASLARLLDDAGVGAICAAPSPRTEKLAAQDGMFTLLIRGETMEGKRIKEERVVQSILHAAGDVRSGEGLELMKQHAADIDVVFCRRGATVELDYASALLKQRFDLGLTPPRLLLVSWPLVYDLTDFPMRDAAGFYGSWEEEARFNLNIFSRKWFRESSADEASFSAWMNGMVIQEALLESELGYLSDAEMQAAQREMNYRDDFIAWAEPYVRLTIDGDAPECIASVCSGLDYASACDKKKRIYDAAVFLCAVGGYLAGKENVSAVLKDEALRAWIGHSFFDEILPTLPYSREEVTPDVVSAFERLENPMNDMKLLEVGKSLLSRFPKTILPAIRACADKNFEAPIGLSLALAAAIMLYAGARAEDGAYCVARGDEKHRLIDDPEILETFARFSHDMPAETLAYAALADRSIWGSDLREIDGLEMRVAYDISSIQRIGFAEALKLKVLEWEA